ncbi:hypothetical protein GWI33_013225 [Rhynchophorus ferrugineus]|uniref:Uncharacterized protein n=1 Tax=Rhynchophorus ferrugineus TaxID=354439 RepID=A0A834M822_RHYFE|nr:hypothetical protein GWI33_013225 [Rhynchophorus ferrugineus]
MGSGARREMKQRRTVAPFRRRRPLALYPLRAPETLLELTRGFPELAKLLAGPALGINTCRTNLTYYLHKSRTKGLTPTGKKRGSARAYGAHASDAGVLIPDPVGLRGSSRQ